jgi:hypothetical protein
MKLHHILRVSLYLNTCIYFIKLQHPLQLHRSDFVLRIFCRLCATSVNIFSSLSLYCDYMFRPNRPSSGVQVVTMKESAAHCNSVLFSYAVASD